MPFIAHEKLPGVEIKTHYPDGERDHTPYHAYLSMDDTNNIHMEVEEVPGGNTELRIVKNDTVIWKHEIPYYMLPEETIMFAVGIRTGLYDVTLKDG